MKRSLLTSLILLFTLSAAFGELKVSLLTVDPGQEVYELEGHTCLRIIDTDTGTDNVVNWGIFDFNAPNFVYRFVKGETDYTIAAYSFDLFMASSGSEGRQVTERQLNLTNDEAARLVEAVSENLMPQNRVYRYNYVKDNCATRPLAMIERALGDTLTNRLPSPAPGTTWRSEMTRFHRAYPWYQFGIDLALGTGIDRQLSAKEMCYAPVNLRAYVDAAQRPDGTPIALRGEEVIVPYTTQGTPLAPTPWWMTPLAVGWALFAITLFVAVRDVKRQRVSRLYNSVLYTVSGIAGLIITFLIFISTHEATTPNWLYLWLNPAAFIFVIGLWLNKLKVIVFCYQCVNFVALLALLVIGAIGVQHLNPAFIPFILSYLITSAAYLLVHKCR